MVNDQKIHGLEDLAAVLDRHREAGRQVVHCHGVFDLLHVGHLRHFEQAQGRRSPLGFHSIFAPASGSPPPFICASSLRFPGVGAKCEKFGGIPLALLPSIG